MSTKKRAKERVESEPMGIVISGGPMREPEPVISAYVWGPAPEPPRNKTKPQAAA